MPITFKSYLSEARAGYSIVVDVQPEYSYNIKFDVAELMEFLNGQKRILMLVNSDREGLTDDSISSIERYWEENGFDNWDKVELIDKGYGYLRSWMDEGISEKTIIKAIREMYKQKVDDSRALWQWRAEGESDAFRKFIGPEFDYWMLEDPIVVDWISVKKLKSFSKSYIMGGAKDECLKEVELLMSAFNIKSTRIRKFVY